MQQQRQQKHWMWWNYQNRTDMVSQPHTETASEMESPDTHTVEDVLPPLESKHQQLPSCEGFSVERYWLACKNQSPKTESVIQQSWRSKINEPLALQHVQATRTFRACLPWTNIQHSVQMNATVCFRLEKQKTPSQQPTSACLCLVIAAHRSTNYFQQSPTSASLFPSVASEAWHRV